MPEYFTEAELRALPDMSSETSARIEAAASWAVSVIEREVGTSFILRSTTETHDGGGYAILLRNTKVGSITSVTVGGVTVSDLQASSGVLRYAGSTPFAYGVGNVVVIYEAGYSATPPADIKEAALQATRWHLLEGRASNSTAPRQTSFSNDMGGTTNLAVAGTDRPTGYPDVDAVIVGWRNKLDVFGFA